MYGIFIFSTSIFGGLFHVIANILGYISIDKDLKELF
jgi:hypothetical protein